MPFFRTLVVLACAMSNPVALAQAFPVKPVRIVIPYPPGAITDTLPRLLADKVREDWGQPVIAENRPGAGGRIGTEVVVRSPPDGHTIVVGIPDVIAIFPHLVKNMPFDPAKDLAPITSMARQSYILVSRPELPYHHVTDLMTAAKAKPGLIRYGSWGEGSAGHLSMEMLINPRGIEMTHVPYKGSAQATLGILGGEIDVMFTGYSSSLPHIKAGKLRVIGRTSSERLPLTPEIPTIAEAGFPGYEVQVWFGLFAPAQTPRGVIDALHRGFVRALNQPDVRARVDSFYAEVVGNTPDEFAQEIRRDRERWGALIRKLKIALE